MGRRPRNGVPDWRMRGDGSGKSGAVITLGGQDHYCGPFETPEGRAIRDQLIARWLANGRRPLRRPRDEDLSSTLTIADLCDRYLAWYEKAQATRTHGREHVDQARRALGQLRTMFGDTAAAEFTAARLKELRRYWQRAKSERGQPFARRTINYYVAEVRSLFTWAADEDVVPASVVVEVRSVRPLRKSEGKARETAPVGPPDPAAVDRVIAAARPCVAAMVTIQRLTGMRPGEVVVMRRRDVDRTRTPWRYEPPRHKTDWRGKSRPVFIGPQGRAVLGPWLDRAKGDDAPVFVTRTGRPYTPGGYGTVIARLCERLGVEHWSPNQLRHAWACVVRSRFGFAAIAEKAGMDEARATLGHGSQSITGIYASADERLAAMVAEVLG